MRFTQAAIATLVAMSMTTGGTAFAQGNSDHENRGNNGRGPDKHQNQDDGRGGRKDHRGERGAGPHHSYYRGDRLPREFHEQRYVVSDWRGRHLSAPPRGYHWVQTGDDYVLVAIATGVILSLMLR